jgi:hypothetical protein
MHARVALRGNAPGAKGSAQRVLHSNGPMVVLLPFTPREVAQTQGRFSFLAARKPADAVSLSHMYAPLFVFP